MPQILPTGPPFRLVGLWLFLLVASVRAQTPVAVELLSQNPGAEIPADFVGLSFEMQRVLPTINGNHFFSPANKNLIATFQTLGIKSLRVGGNTADRPGLPVPDETDADSLFHFAEAADVKVIYTLRLREGSADAAAKMADHIFQNYQSDLSSFAIGNEPNVFNKSFPPYLAQWKIFAAQITAPTNSPHAKFSGPGVSPGHEFWSRDFADELAGSGQIAFISQHDYPGGDAGRVKDVAAARAKILSPAMDEHYLKFADHFVPAAISNGLPYRLEEANSFYDGGATNVSDTFASALWALNYVWWWAAHGASGINFHTGDTVASREENSPCKYAVFWTSPQGCNIHPIGYALKMFSLASRGKMMPVKILSAVTNLNLAAYGILGDDKNFYVTLINKSHDETATNLQISLGAHADGYTKGEIIRLTSPNGDVSLKTGVTLGGAEITDDAKWNGQWQSIAVPRQKFQFPILIELPAASAAVVKLTPE